MEQTRPSPHGSPSGAGQDASQTGNPVEQLVTPRQHGMPSGVQVAPGEHGAQSPALQTSPSPHHEPSGRTAPVSVHAPPAQQSIVPS
jgi:hypothetical protein